VDVQSHVPFDPDLFARIATPAERELYDRLERAGDLSVLWSRKEALVKRSGYGLAASLSGVETMGEASLVTFVSEELDAVFSIRIGGVSERNFCRRTRVRMLELSGGGDMPGRGADAAGVWQPRSLPVVIVR